ncbi:unnamed protein product [Prorocentrum cordatum]|uniref:Uncharacterized protein n=1 Tax=Prorocentrum cordatum TaxID=2364126 RepID=A0ABN9PJD4_9DINO|nr:unnamed protein product [Polarella glacialis]
MTSPLASPPASRLAEPAGPPRDQKYCSRKTLARCTWYDRRDDFGLQLRLPHLAEQRQSPLPLLAFLARADPGAAADMTSDSNFTSRISLSSARARCHSSPFSQALIPAL